MKHIVLNKYNMAFYDMLADLPLFHTVGYKTDGDIFPPYLLADDASSYGIGKDIMIFGELELSALRSTDISRN